MVSTQRPFGHAAVVAHDAAGIDVVDPRADRLLLVGLEAVDALAVAPAHGVGEVGAGAVELVGRRHEVAVGGVGDEDIGVAVEQQDQGVDAVQHLAQQGALGLQLRLALLERRDVAVEGQHPTVRQRASY
jgi:hypothetical protein